MKKATKSKIEDAVEKVALADEAHERAVADAVLRTQTSDVLYELAAAALVDAARARRRRVGLTIERAAEVPATTFEAPTPAAERMEAIDKQHADRRAEIDRRLAESVQAAVAAYERSLRIEWTAELLESEFALGDGTRVTWGEATVEQHRARAEMFQNNAAANLEGAARHRKAIAALSEAGASSLGELVGAGV
jgi:hypothetical protein